MRLTVTTARYDSNRGRPSNYSQRKWLQKTLNKHYLSVNDKTINKYIFKERRNINEDISIINFSGICCITLCIYIFG